MQPLPPIHLPQIEIKPPKPQEPPPVIKPQNNQSVVGEKQFQGSLMRDRIERNFDAGSAANFLQNDSPAEKKDPTVALLVEIVEDPDAVQADKAARIIKNKLDETGIFNDVTRSELEDIEKTVDVLSPEQAKQTFDQLSDADLKKYVSELNSGAIFGMGGYSADEKKQLFDKLAEHLDGKNLARLADAFNSGGAIPTDNSSQSDVQMLVQSVADNAAPEAKVEFAKTLAADAEKNPEKAAAIAIVIGGLKGDGERINAVINSLSDSQLKAVTNAAVNEKFWQGGGAYDHAENVSYDARPLQSMLDAVKTSSDPQVKARVFDAGADVLERVEKTKSATTRNYDGATTANQVRDNLTNLIDSDPQGVVRHLRTDDDSGRRGDAMVAYTKSMIESGQSGEVSELLKRLTKGSENKTPKEHLEENRLSKDGKTTVYDNAKDLGYLVGSIEAATDRIFNNDATQRELFAKILGAAVSDTGAGDIAGAIAEETANGFFGALMFERNDKQIEAGRKLS